VCLYKGINVKLKTYHNEMHLWVQIKDHEPVQVSTHGCKTIENLIVILKEKLVPLVDSFSKEQIRVFTSQDNIGLGKPLDGGMLLSDLIQLPGNQSNSSRNPLFVAIIEHRKCTEIFSPTLVGRDRIMKYLQGTNGHLDVVDSPILSLEGLPPELIHRICIHVPLKQVYHLSQCSRSLHDKVDTNMFWFSQEEFNQAVKESDTRMLMKMLQNRSRMVGIEPMKLLGASFKYDFPCPVVSIVTIIESGNVELLDLLLSYPNVNPSAGSDVALLVASRNGERKMVELLLQDPRVDPSAKNNRVIGTASERGHVDVVNLLLLDPRVDPSANHNYAIVSAAQEGHGCVVQRLLKDSRVDPNDALQLAVTYGRADMVRLLINDQRIDLSANDYYCFKEAATEGWIDVVRAHLEDPRVDILADENHAIIVASEKGYSEMVKLLIQDTRIDPTVNDNYPLRIAKQMGYSDIVQMLGQHPKVRSSWQIESRDDSL
jgi:hypothetical protein